MIALWAGRALVCCSPLLAAGCGIAAKAHEGALVLGCSLGSVASLLLGVGLCAAGGSSLGNRDAEPFEPGPLACDNCGQCYGCDLRGADA